MLTLTWCPQCGAPAEITDRFTLASTDGPIEHVAMECAASHHFRLPITMLPGASAENDQTQAISPRPLPRHTVPGSNRAQHGEGVH